MVAQNMLRMYDLKFALTEKNSDLTTLSMLPNAFNNSKRHIHSVLG